MGPRGIQDEIISQTNKQTNTHTYMMPSKQSIFGLADSDIP
jgi:hypothetical protein